VISKRRFDHTYFHAKGEVFQSSINFQAKGEVFQSSIKTSYEEQSIWIYTSATILLFTELLIPIFMSSAREKRHKAMVGSILFVRE
jgi:hypothetical protein